MDQMLQTQMVIWAQRNLFQMWVRSVEPELEEYEYWVELKGLDLADVEVVPFGHH